MEDSLEIDHRLQEDYVRRPRVLCIITTYNRPELLERAIQSVIAQTLEDWFLVVVDDGSTDSKTLDVLDRSMIACENRMEYQFMGENSGKRLGKVRNTGIRSGFKYQPKYVCFLDDDNTMKSTFMEEMVAQMEANPKADIIYCDSDNFHGDQNTGVSRSIDFHPGIVFGNFIDLGEAMVRQEILVNHGLFDDDLPGCGEDWAQWAKYHQRGVTFLHYARPLCNYTTHPGQTTRDPGHHAVLETVRGRIASGYYLDDKNLVKL